MAARRVAQAYECKQGAALEPLPQGYRRRQPEKSALHEVVREDLESFLAELREEGRGLPRFVEKELRGSCRVDSSARASCAAFANRVGTSSWWRSHAKAELFAHRAARGG